MLSISNLSVQIDDFLLIEDINLEINSGEIHAIIGDYDSGKSTLAHALFKRPDLEIVSGKINFKRKSLKNLQPEDCSRLGMFLSFQDPPVINGLTNISFIETMFRERNLDTGQIEENYKEFAKTFDLGKEWLTKELNSSNSIIERKKNEIAQMLFLNPSLIVLDTLEENLDSTTIEELSETINEFLSRKGKSAIIISRDMDLLEKVVPTHVHLMRDGKIIKSGDKKIVRRIAKNGY